MSTFLINASNLKAGGGLQVADSICCQLNRFHGHNFIVVLSSFLSNTKDRIKAYNNVETIQYDIPNSIQSIVFGKDAVLDGLVQKKSVDAVLTVFGPSRWKPKKPHLCGFALSQMVIPESPYFKRMGVAERFKWRLWGLIRIVSFKGSAKSFWTENPYISERLKILLGNVEVHTVSNYYNQVFDKPELWNLHPLDSFDGITCLSVSSYYPHKNFPILIGAAKVLKKKYPDFKFRFVLTFDEGMMNIPAEYRESFVFIGKVDVSECPDLYRQSNLMVMPTLLECFTATYAEAMRMELPIVTTDMEFARGLCEDAACYYNAVDEESCADAIYRVASDKLYAKDLVEKGKRQLAKYDNYEQRADKLVLLLEGLTIQKCDH